MFLNLNDIFLHGYSIYQNQHKAIFNFRLDSIKNIVYFINDEIYNFSIQISEANKVIPVLQKTKSLPIIQNKN